MHEHGRRWHGPGCPGDCRARGLDGPVLRAALGDGSERWMDLVVGPCSDEVAPAGDLVVRDRDGNWTYGYSVVVDDLRQGIDVVIRGRDLLAATAVQIRLGRLLGRAAAATFAHHPLVVRPDGHKLSKADADTSVRELRAAGRTAPDLIGEAAAAIGLVDARRSGDRGGRGRRPVRQIRTLTRRQPGSERSSISPRVVEGHAKRSDSRRSGTTISDRRAATHPTAGPGSRASRPAGRRSRRGPPHPAASRGSRSRGRSTTRTR